MVQVQSTCFPLMDRSPQTFVPNIAFDSEKDFRTSTIRVYHASRLGLPVRGASPSTETKNAKP